MLPLDSGNGLLYVGVVGSLQQKSCAALSDDLAENVSVECSSDGLSLLLRISYALQSIEETFFSSDQFDLDSKTFE